MPKKWRVNTKAEEARMRRETQKMQSREKESSEKEERYWRGVSEAEKTKADKRREEKAMERRAAVQKREEARELLEKEQKELQNELGGRNVVPKVTAADIIQRKEEVAAKKDEKSKDPRVVDEEQYGHLVDVEIRNTLDEVTGTGVDHTLAALDDLVGRGAEERHPERRRRAAWLAFSERRLQELKREEPGRLRSQYMEMMRDEWKRHPDNPMNKPHAAWNTKPGGSREQS